MLNLVIRKIISRLEKIVCHGDEGLKFPRKDNGN
jgi:hypothetical protein